MGWSVNSQSFLRRYSFLFSQHSIYILRAWYKQVILRAARSNRLTATGDYKPSGIAPWPAPTVSWSWAALINMRLLLGIWIFDNLNPLVFCRLAPISTTGGVWYLDTSLWRPLLPFEVTWFWSCWGIYQRSVFSLYQLVPLQSALHLFWFYSAFELLLAVHAMIPLHIEFV